MSSNSGGSAQGAGLFREIHKHAWLKRTHPAPDNNRLLLRSHKKPLIKSQWTLLCVHDGITPYLEQYGGDISEGSPPQPGSLTAQAVVSHRPIWRATLARTRHVTPAIAAWEGSDEYEFVITTEDTVIRMVAANWEAMQDWVRTLRARLRELGALAAGENVYGAPPVAPALRAHTRDPNSPLPPTPPVPAIRVPGIEHTTSSNRTTLTSQLTETAENTNSETVIPTNSTTKEPINSTTQENVDPTTSAELNCTVNEEAANNIEISQETKITSIFSASQLSNDTVSSEKENHFNQNDSDVESENEDFASLLSSQIARNSESSNAENNVAVAKICGQNICFDDSVLKRNVQQGNIGSDNEFFNEFDQISVFNEKKVNVTVQNLNSIPIQSENSSVYVQSVNGGVYSSVNVQSCNFLSVRENSSDFNVQSGSSLPIKNKNASVNVQSDNYVPIKETSDLNVQSGDSVPIQEEKSSFNVQSEIVILESENSMSNAKVRSDYTKVDLSKKKEHFKQRLLVSNVGREEPHCNIDQNSSVSVMQSGFSGENSLNQSSNVTVIQVSTNREPPHTAIPLMGADIFNFDIPKRNLSNTIPDKRFINVINTENHYGTIFANSKPTTSKNGVFVSNSDTNICKDNESPYGHISLTTTVKLMGEMSSMTVVSDSSANVDANKEINDSNGIYERLTMASTSQNASNLVKPSPKVRRKFLNLKRDLDSNANPTENRRNGQENAAYEFLFMSRTNTNVRTEESRVKNEDTKSKKTSQTSNLARTDGHNSKNMENSMKQENTNAVLNKTQAVNRGLFRRGLTELSLFSKLRGLGGDKGVPGGLGAPGASHGADKVMRRNREQTRNQDGARRRSSSLSGETWDQIHLPLAAPPVLPPGSSGPSATLRVRQAQALWGEQTRGTRAPPMRLRRLDAANVPIALVDAFGAVWVAGWLRRIAGTAHGVLHVGDRLLSVQGVRVHDARQARSRIAHSASAREAHVDLLFQRVPHGRIYVITKEQEQQGIGLVLDAEGEITEVESDSPASRAGLPPDGATWAVTEVNNRPINMLKGGGSQAWSRTCARGKDVSLLLQPAALVSRLRRALRSHRAPHAYLVE